MIYLDSIALKRKADELPDCFPFNLPIIQSIKEIRFSSPVTFLVGENGSGKSTLLETLACAADSIAVGAQSLRTDPTLGPVRDLAKIFRLSWRTRTRKGFFMRAEDFFGYVKKVAQEQEELTRDLRDAEETYRDRSAFAYNQARAPYMRELGDIKSRYGSGLDAQSHGESFLKFFESRFIPGGLYLLDEPEMPLSPLRQITLLAMLKDMVELNAQFIIATHSPIVMAYPGATILNFEASAITEAQYDELEHVTLTRSFLNNPESFLRHL